MNPFREMVLISTDDYQKLRQRATYNTEGLQKDLNDLKQEYGTFLPADQQAKLESEIISKHANKNQIETSTSSPPDTNVDDSLILQHLDSFTKNNKKRALQLYHHLKAFKMQWNSMGQFLNEENEPILNSNIIELINYVTVPSRAKINLPAGFGEFVKLIGEAQTPRNFLSKTGLSRIDTYIDKHEKVATTSEDEGRWTSLFE